MYSPPNYTRAFLRMSFVVMVVTAMLLPQLTAAKPPPAFHELRDLLRTLTTVEYAELGTCVLLLLGVSRAARYVRHKQLTRPSPAPRSNRIPKRTLVNGETQPMSMNTPISRLSIHEAIKLPGGNGLTSPLFELPTEFFGLFSWQHIEAGMEALIMDGRVVRRSDFVLNPLGFFQKQKYARRVLLRPAPLTEISARALTHDLLELTLTVSVNYEVSDPAQVATMEAPLTTLSQLIAGVVAEHIRCETLDTLVRDDGALRSKLKDRLNAADSLRSTFTIIEVLKALPDGDERLIEIKRQAREAELRQDLIGWQGKNRVADYEANHQIAALKAELEERIKAADHQRALQLQQGALAAQNLQSMANAMALSAATGADSSKLVELFLRLSSPGVAPTALSTGDRAASQPLEQDLDSGSEGDTPQ